MEKGEGRTTLHSEHLRTTDDSTSDHARFILHISNYPSGIVSTRFKFVSLSYQHLPPTDPVRPQTDRSIDRHLLQSSLIPARSHSALGLR